MTGIGTPWYAADLVALDLEGSGAQGREQEAILEVALVPLAAGQPVLADAYTTLVNPGRTIPMRPWISSGLTNQALRDAPSIGDVEPELAGRIAGRFLVGHNINVDWRLLHRHCPTVAPAGIIDTLRLARTSDLDGPRSLTRLLDRLNLTDQVNTAVPRSTPHRALWDTFAVALLLGRLVERYWERPPSIAELLRVAAVPTGGTTTESQAALF